MCRNNVFLENFNIKPLFTRRFQTKVYRKAMAEAVEKAVETAAKTAKAENANSLVDNINKALAPKIVDMSVDLLGKLRDKFIIPDEVVKASEKCQSELEKLKFNKFKENFSLKSLTDISIEEFKVFADRLQKRFKLPDDIKESILDGLSGGENQEMLKSFHFQDGEGNIHHARFITLKRNDKIDIAYAMYTLSFELTEHVTNEWIYEWKFYVLPLGGSYKKETQSLSEGQKNKFSQWCEVKLFNGFSTECSKDEK